MARHSRRSHHHRYTFSGITDAYFLTTPLPASYGNAVSESRRAASLSDGPQDSLPHQSIIFPNNFLLETPSFVFEFEDPSSLLYDTRVYDKRKGDTIAIKLFEFATFGKETWIGCIGIDVVEIVSLGKMYLCWKKEIYRLKLQTDQFEQGIREKRIDLPVVN